jgi:serine/threonine protein kinase
MLCPKCRRSYPEDDVFCPFDGTPLVTAESFSRIDAAARQRADSGEEERPTARMSVEDVETALASGEHPVMDRQRRPPGEVKPTARMSVEDVEAALASGEHPAMSPAGGPAVGRAQPRVPSRQNPTVQLPPNESSTLSPKPTPPPNIAPAPPPVARVDLSAEPPPVVLSTPSAPPGTLPEITESFTNVQPGSTVGEYEITGVLGHGGMTQVFSGIHPIIGKRVALKILHAQFSKDDSLLGRFVQEAQAVNQVGSDRIVDIFGFGHLPDGRAYLVMNQVDGQPLSDLIELGGPLATTQAHSIFLDVANALAAAHSVGIIHRDVKPSNIMVQTDSYGSFRAKVLDFGVAKLLRTDAHAPGVNTAQGTMIGTPLFMSPEQVKGQAVDARSDAYALGVTMFQALTGDIPFDVNYDMDIAIAHVEQTPRVPSSLRPNLSPEWDQLILECLEKDPARRPQSMAVVQTRLARLGASATRGGTGYVDLPSYVNPADVITALDAEPVRPPPRQGSARWPMLVAALTGAALLTGALLYWLAR